MLKKYALLLGTVAIISVGAAPRAEAVPPMAEAAIKYYEKFENGCSVDWDTRLAQAGRYYVYKENGKQGLLDSQGKIVVEPYYSEIIDMDKDTIIVRKGSKYGLIKRDGMEVLMPKYDEITYNLELNAFETKKGKGLLFFDHEGNILNNPSSSQLELKDLIVPVKFPKGTYFNLRNGGRVTVNGNKYIVTDYSGSKVATYKGDFINQNYKGGFLIGEGKKYSFFDSNMQPLQTIKAETILELPNGVFEITRIVHGLSVVGLAKTAISFGLDSYGGIADRWFNPGKRHNRRDKEKFGYVNHLGEEFVPTKFDYLGNFYMGQALVRDNSSYGYASENGNYPVPVEFEDISVRGLYSPDTVVVKKSGKYGLYGLNKAMLAYGYQDAANYVNGLAPVKLAEGQWGYVDKAGNMAIAAQYDSVTPFYDEHAMVKVKDSYAIIDRAGKLVASIPEAKEASALRGGSAVIKTTAGYFLVDLQGNRINELPYNNLKIYHPLEGILGKW